MTQGEIRRRLAVLRAERADIGRAIAALEKLEAMRLGRVVELVPREEVLRTQRLFRAMELEPAAVA